MKVTVTSKHYVNCEECRQRGLYKWPETFDTRKEASAYAQKHRQDHKDGDGILRRGIF